jgi:predicted PurR-regulated permease PerM
MNNENKIQQSNYENKIHLEKKEKYTFFLLFFLSTFYVYELLTPFLKTIFCAFLLFLATIPLIKKLQKKYFKKDIYIASFMSIVLLFIFIAPLTYSIATAIDYLSNIDYEKIPQYKKTIVDYIFSNQYILEYLPNSEQLKQKIMLFNFKTHIEELINIGKTLSSNSLGFLTETFLISLFYFFFILYKKEFFLFATKYLSLKNKKIFILLKDTTSVMNVVLYSTIINILFQGILFGVFVAFFGYNGLLLGVLYGISSLIPIVGAGIVIAPVFLYEYFINHNLFNAIVIGLYSIIFIATIADNIFKPIIIGKLNHIVFKGKKPIINEIVIFFAIIFGMTVYGFWGILIGPAILSFFLSFLIIYKKYSF